MIYTQQLNAGWASKKHCSCLKAKTERLGRFEESSLEIQEDDQGNRFTKPD